MLLALFLAFVALALAGCGVGRVRRAAPERFDAERAFSDLEAQVEIGPRPSGSKESEELVDFLVDDRSSEAGAEDVAVQRPYRTSSRPSRAPAMARSSSALTTTRRTFPGFVGANDGASGVAVVLELARVLAAEAPLDGPSISIALFDAEEARGERPFEEDGTRGSQQYVAYAESGGEQGSPALGEMRR